MQLSNASPAFLRFAALCAFISAVTTFGVHLLPLLHPAPTFETQLQLAKNPVYIFRLWVVIIHILLVLGSMWGVAVVKFRTAPGWIGLGIGGYFIFGLAELFRISIVMNAVNPIRLRYLQQPDPALKATLLNWPHLNDALFFLLVIGFLIGNLFYAIAFRKGVRLERWISLLLFIWSGLSLATLLQEYLYQTWINFIPEFISYTYQPFVRILFGIWLWIVAKETAKAQSAQSSISS
jgi:hypothetical protein